MNISESDLVGIYRMKSNNPQRICDYFKSIEFIRPLIVRKGFLERITGFYLNAHIENTLRLTYFIRDNNNLDEIILDFLDNNENIFLFNKEEPKKVVFSKNYGGTEIRFRKYLHTYSQISLDLLDYDLHYSRNLVAKYRFEYSSRKKVSRSLFKPAFEKHSKYYNSLPQDEKEQVFLDLDFWHGGRDWAHMMVNALLPGDQNPNLIKYPIVFRRVLEGIDLEYDEKWVP